MVARQAKMMRILKSTIHIHSTYPSRSPVYSISRTLLRPYPMWMDNYLPIISCKRMYNIYHIPFVIKIKFKKTHIFKWYIFLKQFYFFQLIDGVGCCCLEPKQYHHHSPYPLSFAPKNICAFLSSNNN